MATAIAAEVSSNIIGVSTASAEAGTAAGEVLSASSALRRETDVLRSEIDAFLSNIRALGASSFRDRALAPDLRCAIAHRGTSRFRALCFA